MAQTCDEKRRVLISMDVNDIYSKLKVGEGWLKPNLHNKVKKERITDIDDICYCEHKEKERKGNISEKFSNCKNSHTLFHPRDLKDIEAYYINENFEQSSLSLRKLRLNEELSKLSGQYAPNEKNSETMSYEYESACMYNQLGNLMTNTPNLHKAFQDIKAFREKFFFECHSADAMLNQKINTIRDLNHECQYDFYLNKRLFLVPKCSDNFNQTRCSSCYLPVAYELEEKLDSNLDRFFKPDEMKQVETLSDIETVEESLNNYEIKNDFTVNTSKSKKSCDRKLQCSDKQNGIANAKISFNSKSVAKDIVIGLPVKMSLVVKEKWPNLKIFKDVKNNNIGVIQIDNDERVKYKYSIPEDSFALKYQKGYTNYKA